MLDSPLWGWVLTLTPTIPMYALLLAFAWPRSKRAVMTLLVALGLDVTRLIAPLTDPVLLETFTNLELGLLLVTCVFMYHAEEST
jgi:hypothetical protein